MTFFIYESVTDLINWAMGAADALRPWVLEVIFPIFVHGILELRASAAIRYARDLLNQNYCYFSAWHAPELQQLRTLLEMESLDIPSPLGMYSAAEQIARHALGKDTNLVTRSVNNLLSNVADARFLFSWLDPRRPYQVAVPKTVHKMFLRYITSSMNFFSLAVFNKKVLVMPIKDEKAWEGNMALSRSIPADGYRDHLSNVWHRPDSEQVAESMHDTYKRTTSPQDDFVPSSSGITKELQNSNVLSSTFYREAINCRMPEANQGHSIEGLKLNPSIKEVLEKNVQYELRQFPASKWSSKYNEISFTKQEAFPALCPTRLLRAALVNQIACARVAVGQLHLKWLYQRVPLISSQEELNKMLSSRCVSFNGNGELVATERDASQIQNEGDAGFGYSASALNSIALKKLGPERLQSMQGVPNVKSRRPPSAVCMNFTKGYGNIECVSCDSEGEIVAVGCMDSSIRVFDFFQTDPGGTESISLLTGHDTSVTSVNCTPDGKWLISADTQGTILLWAPKFRTKEESNCYRHALCSYQGHFGPVWCLEWNRCVAGMFASGGRDGVVRLWFTHHASSCRLFLGHGADITCLRFLSNGTLLLSGSRDGTMFLWDVHSGVRVREFKGHYSEITTLDISPSEDLIAVGTANGLIKLWSTNGACLTTIHSAHASAITCVRWSACQSVLTSSSGDGCIRCWGVNSLLSHLDRGFFETYFRSAPSVQRVQKGSRNTNKRTSRSQSPEGNRSKEKSQKSGKRRRKSTQQSSKDKAHSGSTSNSAAMKGKKLGHPGSFLNVGVQLALAYLRKARGIGSYPNMLHHLDTLESSNPQSDFDRARQLLVTSRSYPESPPLYNALESGGACISEWWTLESNVMALHVTRRNLVLAFSVRKLHFHKK